jgi:hypothetical protein
MLVYLKEPMGYTSIGPYRIYGKRFSNGAFGASIVPKELFQEHKDILEEAEYTKDWLEEKFGRTFPDISFRISELSKLEMPELIGIAHGLGIDFKKKKSYTLQDKNGLKRSITNMLS